MRRLPPDPSPTDPQISFPGDAPSGRARGAWPLALAAIGLLLALIGTLPPQSWTLPDLRPATGAGAIADWAFVAALAAAVLIAISVVIAIILVGRGPSAGKKKVLPGQLNWREALLMTLVSAIILALAFSTRFLSIPGLDLSFGFWPQDEAAGEAAVAAAGAPYSWSWTSATAQWLFDILTSTFGIVALVAGFVLTVFSLVVLKARERARSEDAEDENPLGGAVALAAEGSLEDLEAGGDPRATIIKCYVRFERSLAAAETRRAAWQTPLEFMRTALATLPLKHGDVDGLTRLFERARFSTHPMGAADQQTAVTALTAIRAALASRAVLAARKSDATAG